MTVGLGNYFKQRHSTRGAAVNNRLRCLLAMLWLLALSAPLQAGATPARVVSLNLCTDQLLLMLADEHQIAAVTHLSTDPDGSYMSAKAQRLPLHHGSIEEILARNPDLVLTGEFGKTKLKQALQRLQIRVEELPLADSIEGIRQNLRRAAQWLGQEQRGAKLLQEMQRRIDAVAGKQRSIRPLALFYAPRGYSSGSGTLQDEALTIAGWRNLSAEAGLRGYAAINLETLLLRRPQQFFTSGYAPHTHSLAQRQLQHPALRQVTDKRPIVEIPYAYWICGGPMIADAVEALDQAHRWNTP